MNKDESPIHSMKVSLGTPQAAPSASSQQQQPWVVLICSDLGFVSKGPQRVSAATLNEFLTATEVTINGTVEVGLPADIAPFYIEYCIQDVKDLSPSSLPDKLPYLQRLKSASKLLDDISRKRIASSEGFRQIASMQLPQSIVRILGTVVPAGGNSTGTTPHTPSSSKIDSILSMIDVEDARVTAPAKAPPADFVAALTEGGNREFSPSALLSSKEAIDNLIAELCAVIIAQPFFKAANSSWNALKTLLKIAGRSRDIHFFVHAAPFDAAERHIGDAIAGCGAESGIPDLVIWDYPVSMDTATMQQLEQVGSFADRYKTVVVASLDYHDDLYKKILDREPLRTVLEHPAYIPFKRLKETAQARCLALCLPDALMQRNQSGQEIAIAGAWLFVFQWLTSVIENSSPFHLQNDSIAALDGFAFPKLSNESAADADQCAITLLRPNSTTTPHVLLDTNDTPYGSLLFNLLVNRTARLAAGWIGKQEKSLSCEMAAPAIEHFLQMELRPYSILSSDSSVSVTVKGQSLQVTIDSDVTVAGFPVKFQFSFNYRE